MKTLLSIAVLLVSSVAGKDFLRSKHKVMCYTMPSCNWRDPTNCVFQGYSLRNGVCESCNQGNPTYSATGLKDYSTADFIKWLNHLSGRNSGFAGPLSERSVVEDYRVRCDETTGIAKPPPRTTVAVITNPSGAVCNWRLGTACIFEGWTFSATSQNYKIAGSCYHPLPNSAINPYSAIELASYTDAGFASWLDTVSSNYGYNTEVAKYRSRCKLPAVCDYKVGVACIFEDWTFQPATRTCESPPPGTASYSARGLRDYTQTSFVSWLNGLANKDDVTKYKSRCPIPSCNWRDTSSCVFDGYKPMPSGECQSITTPSNPSYSTVTIANYNVQQFTDWVNAFPASSLVTSFKARCPQPQYPFVLCKAKGGTCISVACNYGDTGCFCEKQQYGNYNCWAKCKCSVSI